MSRGPRALRWPQDRARRAREPSRRIQPRRRSIPIRRVTRSPRRQRGGAKSRDHTGNPSEARREIDAQLPVPPSSRGSRPRRALGGVPRRAARSSTSRESSASRWFAGDGDGHQRPRRDLELGQERGRHAGLGRRRSARSSRSTRCCPGACACRASACPTGPATSCASTAARTCASRTGTMRFEIEYLRGRDAELATPSFNPLDAYRSDVEDVDGDGQAAARRAAAHAGRARCSGRVPFLEPLDALRAAAARASAFTDLAVSTGLAGRRTTTRSSFAWQALAGIGYQLNERVKLSLGWRYLDFGEAQDPALRRLRSPTAGAIRSTSRRTSSPRRSSIWFWQLPPLLGEE